MVMPKRPKVVKHISMDELKIYTKKIRRMTINMRMLFHSYDLRNKIIMFINSDIKGASIADHALIKYRF